MLQVVLTVVLFGLVIPSEGHLCLLNPPQRGQLRDLNVKGTQDCFQVQGPCGSISSPDVPHTKYLISPGTNFTVVFQKNLDHFNKASPGYFSVALGKKSSSVEGYLSDISFKVMAKIPDSTTPSLELYTVDIVTPEPYPWYILQVAYVTNNPKAPAVFYQCADFALVKM